MQSYYMLIPITMQPEDWTHKERENLSIIKATEIQEFLMGRISEIGTLDNAIVKDEDENDVSVKTGIIIKCNSLQKRIVNGFAIVEVDCELMKIYGDDLMESCVDNNVDLFTHAEIRQYIKDNEVSEII